MFRSLRTLTLFAALVAAGSLCSTDASAQVTTGSMRGSVTDSTGIPLAGARVKATHRPSGTEYRTTTTSDGRWTLPGLRVGGPYTVEATRIGMAPQSKDGLIVTLGTATDVNFKMGAIATTLGAVTVTSTGGQISTTRTGASTTVPQAALEQLPTISRRIDDFTRLTPQASGSSFAGVDNRLNNITVDGAYFNNSFGLAGQPGDRTGVAPISLDAIEAIQVNIAPFDVRQGNFVGAAVNTVTKSGTNEFSGSLYYLMRDQSMVGTRVGGQKFNPGTFDFSQIGFRLGGPILSNKLFFFVSYETDGLKEPGTTFTANTGTQTVAGTTTRVLKSDLDALSTYLQTNFGYATGPYQDYTHEVPSMRLTAKIDYALSDRNKFTFRYTKLDSKTDVLLSNSSSLGFGSRRSSSLGLNFQNSNYQILENINSYVGEWNAIIGSNMANNMIIGYTDNDESRDSRGSIFPMVDVLNAASVYTTFGFEPFTPNNELRYKSFQFQNNFTIYGNNHDLTFGVSAEKYKSENVFFPGSQSAYVYNSLADFYLDANDFLANPNRTVSPIVPVGHPGATPAQIGQPLSLRRFQVRWNNIPGQVKPIQPLEVTFAGIYAQDEWRATEDLKVTFGLRVESPSFGNTGFANAQADAMNFRDETGATVQYSTAKLPDAKLLFSPRLGINWDVKGDGVTQIRGGTGIFTGRPAYVWISNQIGNNGVLTGFEQLDNISSRPFHPDPNHYKPTTVTGAPASSYELNFTDPNFKFPQLWRTNIAVDRKLPGGLIGTVEWLLGQDVNGVYYIDANLSQADGIFAGPDKRPRWFVDDCPTVSGVQQRLNCNISAAVVLKNQNVGNQWNLAGSLEKAFSNGLFAKAAYSYGSSRNTVDAGSIASGSFTSNQHPGDPNNPGVGYSGTTLGHRFFTAVSYTRKILPYGPTGISVFLESRTGGNGSYTYGGDMNGDGGTGNDLIYIPKNTSEMNFQQFVASGTTFTVAQQVAAFEKFIQQDRYLRNHRGGYVERGAILFPILTRMDVSVTQDIIQTVGGKPNKLQFRLDILNFTNMFNSDWGRGYSFVSGSPLVPAGVDGAGAPVYRVRNIGTELISRSFQRNTFTSDVWRLQLGARYTFN
ncbi:MAG: carboxypeptidase regulatory-like domain-containing protein [Gemmatimonadetes bacterium]|nr:carboxypeptidase regulatory-like domain-containing protein [Gemmatimonadota bacterium]